MAKSREEQKSRRARREEERKRQKYSPLIKKLQEFDVRLQIISGKLGQLSAIMRNFTVCIMVLKDKGILNDEDIGAKDIALRDAQLNKDSQNPESGVVQPEGARDTKSDLTNGGRKLSGESGPDRDGGSESIEDTSETGSIPSEAVAGDSVDSIGGAS